MKLKQQYQQNGFLYGVDILSLDEAVSYRRTLEQAESKIGALHYKSKVHVMLRSAYDLCVNETALDIVEQLIGPDILLHNATYIIKEPHSNAFVSWHQDLTYWGFDSEDVVTMWLALSPATEQSGCMRMLPGSHKNGKQLHTLTEDENNVLFSGQTVANVSDRTAVATVLQPGQASFHHGWTLHTSASNQSDDRRIGLNVQYIAPHVKQTKNCTDTTILVRGQDRFQYFKSDVIPNFDLEPKAVTRQQKLDQLYIETATAKKA